MEAIFKGLAESLGKFKNIEQLAKEGLSAINSTISEGDFTEEQLLKMNEGREEINKQLEKYKKECQLLSKIESTRS